MSTKLSFQTGRSAEAKIDLSDLIELINQLEMQRAASSKQQAASSEQQDLTSEHNNIIVISGNCQNLKVSEMSDVESVII